MAGRTDDHPSPCSSPSPWRPHPAPALGHPGPPSATLGHPGPAPIATARLDVFGKPKPSSLDSCVVVFSTCRVRDWDANPGGVPIKSFQAQFCKPSSSRTIPELNRNQRDSDLSQQFAAAGPEISTTVRDQGLTSQPEPLRTDTADQAQSVSPPSRWPSWWARRNRGRAHQGHRVGTTMTPCRAGGRRRPRAVTAGRDAYLSGVAAAGVVGALGALGAAPLLDCCCCSLRVRPGTQSQSPSPRGRCNKTAGPALRSCARRDATRRAK